MLFQYKGRDQTGKAVSGKLDAQNRRDALAQLQQKNILVSSLTRSGTGFSLTAEFDLGKLRARSSKVTAADLAAFCGQFSTLVAAGVPLLQTLDLLALQFRPKRLSTILTQVIQSIQSGNSMSQAMSAHRGALPGTLIYITSVAEVTGSLDTGYALLARQFEQEDDLARKVRGAMTYPIVVLSVATVIVAFMLTYVLPNYATMFASLGANLPLSTRILMTVGNFVKFRWFLLIPIPFVAVYLWRTAMKSDAVREMWQRLLLRLPLIGQIVYKREIGRLTRTLGTMVGSGVPLLSALASVREATDFIPMHQALGRIQEQVRSGSGFGQALRSEKRLIDPIAAEMISLGEASGNLEMMLGKVAEIAEKDLSSLLERSTALMEPAMTLVLGLVVLMIMVPMMLPMFDIFKQIH